MTKKENIQIGIIIVCLLLIGVILMSQFMARDRKPARAKQSGAAGSLTGVMPVEALPAPDSKLSLPPLSPDIAKKQKTFLQRPWGRNPFVLMATKPDAEDVPKASELVNASISAIVMRGDVGMALINDEMVKPGDTFRGYQVKSVNMNGVVLIKEGETVTIPYAK